MPFADYADFDDCVSKNPDKDDPEAYCAEIKRKTEAMRHRDFSRIYDEFINYYKDALKGESEYYQWLKALTLDEAQPYGFAAESFRWAKDMIRFLREDTNNKYYEVLIGFPIESMNGNVYKERDLIAAALSLKGKHVSLNHKDEFWFSPNNSNNRWGNISVVGGKFEDGAAEAVIQVPKDMKCPICDGANMTELIDNQRIVNVSLEGSCAIGSLDGTCEGFEFGDPPFTLLTTDVLPGIPLARIKPLEHIMVEALQTRIADETKPKWRIRTELKPKQRIRIKLKLKEQDDHPCADGQVWNDTEKRCETPQKDLEQAQHECPEGEHWDTEQAKCVAEQLIPDQTKDYPDHPMAQHDLQKPAGATDEPNCSEGEVWDPRQGKCVTPTTQEDAMALPENTPQKPDLLDKARGTVQRISPDVSQGLYPTIGTISPNEPATSLGNSPGILKIHPAMETAQVAVTKQPKTDDLTHDLDTTPVHLRPMVVPTAPEPTSKDTGGTHYFLEQPEDEPPIPGPENVPESPQDLAGQEIGKPKEPHSTCIDGHHWDYAQGKCIPDEPITELIRRVKAEAKLVEKEKGRKAFEQYYIDLLKKERGHNHRLNNHCAVVERHSNKLTRLYDNAVRDLRNEQVKSAQWRRLRYEATGQRDDFRRAYEKQRLSYEDVNSKYHATLKTNLELSQKMTKDNEEYLELHKKFEALQEAYKRQKNLAKKVVRVKV